LSFQQLADASNSEMLKTHARDVLTLTKLLVQVTLTAMDNATLQTSPVKVTKSEETKTTASLAEAAVSTKFQTLLELLVFQDHQLTVDVLAEEITPDINASHAQLDKSLIHLTHLYAELKMSVPKLPSDSQETQPDVLDAKSATSQV
jgi:hypothetical protein